MKLIDHRKKGVRPEDLIEAILSGKFDQQYFDTYYIMEKQLLHHLQRVEKEHAKRTIERIIETLFLLDHPPAIKYFFVTLSSLVSQQLEKNELSPSEAYAFQIACFTLIDLKLTNDNAIEFASELIEFYMHMLSDQVQPSFLHPIVNHVIIYIDKRITSPLTVEGIAKKLDVSASHLSRIFREQAGVTLVEYMNMKRIEESQYYLRFTELKIAEISARFKFCNQSYYTRVFKKYTGMTPRQFRDRDKVVYFTFTSEEVRS